MTSFYSSSSAQGDVLSTPYVQDHSLVSYSEAPIIHDNMMTYLNPSSSKTFSEMNGRNEVMFIQSNDDHQLSIVNCDRNMHSLSLSLNTQMSNAVQTSIGFRCLNNSSYNTYQYEQAGTANAVSKSKYVKAAQQLLDEMVSVRGSLKVRQEFGVEQNLNEAEPKPVDTKGKSSPSADAKESALSSSQEISSTERHDLQNKLDKLISMLDDVEKRYKQYYHQMQILVSSFDLVAGGGAAKPYTDLALKTISRHFRCLRDAVSGQIEATRKSIGKQDPSQGEVIPRLRYIDQKLRQQRTLLQFGMLRHAWGPQRGLPENAVMILRAWLFEHFLHPYPKDSEKMMLARQTGLARNQVANWFINARVRLWKPMVEEMYKEEFHLNSKSSQENSSSQDESNTINTLMTRSTTNPGSIIDSGGFYAQEQNGLMSYQVSLALGLRRVEGDVDQLGTNFRPGVTTENANGAGSGVEYSYLDPGNQQQRFGESNLVNDFVA